MARAVGPSPAVSAAPAAARPGEPTAPGDILVVDDSRDARALYQALLGDDDHRVRTAASGEAALAAIAASMPDLVLLDVSMPGMDGWEVLRRLRAMPGGGPAVVMLTAAHPEAQAIERGIKEGADAYLAKPIEGRELCARIRGTLEVHRLRRMLETHRRDQIAMLVHDLRHPLSSLGFLAELLAADDLPAGERSQAVETMRRMCVDMSRLVDGMLAASRLEAGVFAVDVRPTDAAAVVEPSLAVFRPIAARRRIELSWTGDRGVRFVGDAPKLRQAVDNLVSNAVKFAPKGGHVSVRTAREGNRVVLEVADDGPGVPPDERESIFARYAQGARGRASGGAGLGLAIALGIAAAHGGGLDVSDGPLGGAAFTLWVPAP